MDSRPETTTSANRRRRRWGVWNQSGIVGAALLLEYGLVAPIAYWHGGRWGLAGAAVAAGLCAAGAVAALLVAQLLEGFRIPFYGMLAGMLPRMGVPLAAGVFLQVRGGPLADAGLLVYLVVFYPVALGTETVVWLRSSSASRGPGDAPQATSA